jgi:hypothetical protein
VSPARLTLVTGAQSGVDRAALDVALECGLGYQGWCPQGGWAEDLTAPPGLLARYLRLRQTPLADPAQRTEWNVRDADAVLILIDRSGLAASRGTGLARELAQRHGKPLLVLGLDEPDGAARAACWLDPLVAAGVSGAPLKLGIGGPRESEAPGIYRKAKPVLTGLLGPFASARPPSS